MPLPASPECSIRNNALDIDETQHRFSQLTQPAVTWPQTAIANKVSKLWRQTLLSGRMETTCSKRLLYTVITKSEYVISTTVNIIYRSIVITQNYDNMKEPTATPNVIVELRWISILFYIVLVWMAQICHAQSSCKLHLTSEYMWILHPSSAHAVPTQAQHKVLHPVIKENEF